MSDEESPVRVGSTADLVRRMDRIEQRQERQEAEMGVLSATVARVEINQNHAAELTKLRFDALERSVADVGGTLRTFMGRIEAIPLLIQAMENEDTTAAAGAAFQRITGASASDIAGARPEPPPPQPDLETEFADDAAPPDPGKAKAWWETRRNAFDPVGRWQAGDQIVADQPTTRLHRLPLAARQSVFLAARARQGSRETDVELELRASLQLPH